ncbi:MAG: 4-hydroxythreonine-4-phosphate dehydrogenase PdxA [Deltaproteobacteria bacterium RIFCSPLOWO2_01_44_7]|nr:MAG: 4-hydroxythreonine-4-phosphate dehydrogenase PdxA [Deltaproteobacteria bacterium RIFCSPHIGHO2_01_FULL_43_49]OGQ14579.1 MAG: 4-hydroxythreonine-4-phosphate dehydrogenase PdxA [Deltaproteobacteria bacterium RIFCSPHIGHO2_02_FULL_44_53]OGQ27965.1 MAG: 4-hydroxythreonine-4-phosphate dehydrogenase PdxA [Deltaproteobacteria bacterium RIFCSPHIGHO2_12_FULL_44_21]OGQ31177.1 MAG: 4-hydroxythreonine-4-phosphate dehydrogenase PdxA [Deltaproteobacteria bacterium RIFCSPLOWO2_01_FULL_45_74]OGQ38782.1 M
MIIGITTGDPKGVGPEIVQEALEDPDIKSLAEFRVFGPIQSQLKLSDREAAEIALRSLEQGVEEAIGKRVQALVTGPVNKARLRLVDPTFIGHTEFFANHCHAKVCPIFVARNWRVALVTRHIPLAQVAQQLNAIDILQTIRMTHKNLQKLFGILEPKIAVAGLNPHAGEQGLLGEEETKIIRPAIMQAAKEGIDVEGPFSPDTLFWKMTSGKWDAIVAMYHDQGLIPIKTLAFKDTVQITLGLPFLRVSVDHGTAEDIVGTGKADSTNLKAAIRLACQLG